ncbi:MAG: PGF-pre-PGF domain-containing protein [Chloroflexi bacterium]|nr:PGF-pre-PGF domain-containing protein [Chloroflexota bacterium]
MKRKIISVSVSIAVLAATVLLPASALAVPRPPHVFRGTVTVSSNPAQDGLTITAAIAGATFPYSLSANTSGGRYGDDFQFKVPADDSDTSNKEGGVNGNTVVFYIQGVEAGTAIFESGVVSTVNLAIDALPTLPKPTNVRITSSVTDDTPTFAWNAVTGAVSYQTRIDTANFTSIGNVTTVTFTTVADGNHFFRVRAVDNIGTAGESSDLLAFTIDTIPPEINADTLHPNPTNNNTPTFEGTVTDTTSAIASVEYLVDGAGNWAAATAVDGAFDSTIEDYTFSISSQNDGAHYVEVRATDNASQVSTFARDDFVIDTVAPAVTLTALTPDPTGSNTPTFTGNATDATTKIDSVQFRVSGNTTFDWTAATRVGGGAFSAASENFTFTTPALGEGWHKVEVRATDNATNVSTTLGTDTFVMDTVAPAVTLHALASETVTTATPTFTGNVTDSTTTVAAVQYRVSGSTTIDWTDTVRAGGGAFSVASENFTFTTSTLSNGSHTVEVRARDVVGNASQAPYASATFTVSVSAPPFAGGPLPPPVTVPPVTPPPVTPPPEVTPPPTVPPPAVPPTVTPPSPDQLVAMRPEDAGKVIEQMAPKDAAALVEKVTAEQAAGIIEKMAVAKAAAVIESLTSDKAAAIVEKAALSQAAGVIATISSEKAAEIIEKVATDKAAAVIGNIQNDRAAAILEKSSVEKAAGVMEQLSTQKLGNVIPSMSEKALTERLPGLSAAKLFSIEPEVLFDALPNAPTEQLVSEKPPTPPAGLAPPVVVSTTPSGAKYLTVKTLAGEWVTVVGTPLPLDKLLIRTKRAMTNVNTLIEILDKRPSGVAALPAGLAVLAYVDVAFENASPENIEVGHMTFKVDQEWLKTNSIHKWSIALNRWDAQLGKWVSLPAKRGKEDDAYVYYSAVITHFSVFAITGSQTAPPPAFTVANLVISPTGGRTGKPVTITADVTNPSGVEQVSALTLWVNGTAETAKDISLKAGETKKISYTVTQNTEGNYQVRLDRLFGSFGVTRVAAVNWGLIGGIIAVVIIAGLIVWLAVSRRRVA